MTNQIKGPEGRVIQTYEDFMHVALECIRTLDQMKTHLWRDGVLLTVNEKPNVPTQVGPAMTSITISYPTLKDSQALSMDSTGRVETI